MSLAPIRKSSPGKKTKNPKQTALLSMRTTSPPSIRSSFHSNGKYIDCERFSPRTPTHQYFTPTITSASDHLTTNDLGNPSHINIHTSTNDLDKSRTSQCISNYTHRQKLSSHHSLSAQTVSINKGKNLIQNLEISASHT